MKILIACEEKPTDIKSNYKPYLPSNTGGKKRGQKYQFVNITQKESSKTFSGVAKAMAEQWGTFIRSRNRAAPNIRNEEETKHRNDCGQDNRFFKKNMEFIL